MFCSIAGNRQRNRGGACYIIPELCRSARLPPWHSWRAADLQWTETGHALPDLYAARNRDCGGIDREPPGWNTGGRI